MPVRILLVDDEIDFVVALSNRLVMRNYEVIFAFSGDMALKEFDHKKFDVVLLDILMPGIGGLETYERIRSIDPAVRVIMLSAHTDLSVAINQMKKGVFDYLIKPIEIEDLIEKIELAYHHKNISLET
ncbi:MAG: response regulator [Deltaproteobacteria bacterium]|jgi:DNA-binding NtrC family response regulator|nr:response regulator [Deltaproteobacteria bacterium]MBT4527811.1 response regulator [Deltaproteobacteria bacterium]